MHFHADKQVMFKTKISHYYIKQICKNLKSNSEADLGICNAHKHIHMNVLIHVHPLPHACILKLLPNYIHALMQIFTQE